MSEPRDADSWAKPVDKLSVSQVPEGALNLNVEGRRVTSPLQGFGKMWQKTYTVRLGTAVKPADVIRTWKERFPEFWPEGNQFYAPLTGIKPGDVALLNLTMPGKLKLSTGVLVMYADDESFTLMTPEGHMFAGWITFSAREVDGETIAQAQVLMRAQNPVSELGLTLGGHRKEDKFWQHTLAALARHHGVESAPTRDVVCVDKRRQWRRIGNIRHDAAIRTTMYSMTRPFRRRRDP
jgi:hypothetical protein